MTTIASADQLFRFFNQGDEQVAVLKGLSLEVAEREFVCVMGPSGSGKSTLLHVLSGIDQPDSGKVTLAGEVLQEITERRRTAQRQTMLVGELNHRVKNALAIVQSLVQASLRQATSKSAQAMASRNSSAVVPRAISGKSAAL